MFGLISLFLTLEPCLDLSQTLVFLRVIDWRNVSGDAKHHYRECSDFLRCVVEAHIVAAAFLWSR